MFKEYCTPVSLPIDLTTASLLSNLFNAASNGLTLSVEKVLHFAKSGSLAVHAPFTVCPNAGNTTLVPNSLTNNSPPLLAS